MTYIETLVINGETFEYRFSTKRAALADLHKAQKNGAKGVVEKLGKDGKREVVA